MSKSIAQIRQEFESAGEREWEELFLLYAEDTRSGVRNLIERYGKKQAALAAERERLYAMRSFERKYEGYELICGIDEAGRGPLEETKRCKARSALR